MIKKDLNDKFIPGETRIKYGGAVTGPEEKKAINAVIDRNWWVLDEEARLFQEELAKAAGVKYSVFTNAGSTALFLAVGSLNLPKGSEVIIPAVNFPTAVTAVTFQGLKPVFVDADPGNYCIDPSKIEKAVSKNTKAVIVVNIAGNTPNIKEIVRIAKKHKLLTILDNCDGFGTTFDGKPIESYFDVAATSFHAAHIITTGEGGAFFTNDEQKHKLAVSIREWGRAFDSDLGAGGKFPSLPEDYPSRYTYIARGLNFKPIELQAAMGRVQLRRLQKIKSDRRKNAMLLMEGLSKFTDHISLPTVHQSADLSWFSFPISVKEGLASRKDLIDFLEKKNIETRVIFAGNILKQPAFLDLECRVSGDLTNSDFILKNSFFISVHPSLTKEMIDYVIQSFAEYFELLESMSIKLMFNGKNVFVARNGVNQININYNGNGLISFETQSKEGQSQKAEVSLPA